MLTSTSEMTSCQYFMNPQEAILSPSSPGRVVTLIQRSFWETLGEQASGTTSRVYGAAYRIPREHVKEVQEYLDVREINRYSIRYTPFHPAPSKDNHPLQPIQICLVYIGLPSNPQFVGKQDPQDVAEVIATSVGPSGRNSEYLFMLEEALERFGEGSGDGHISDLAGRVRALMGEGKDSVMGEGRGERRAEG